MCDITDNMLMSLIFVYEMSFLKYLTIKYLYKLEFILATNASFFIT